MHEKVFLSTFGIYLNIIIVRASTMPHLKRAWYEKSAILNNNLPEKNNKVTLTMASYFDFYGITL